MMNTKILLIASSFFLGILGLLFSFLPQEMFALLNIESDVTLILLTQCFSSLYLALAMMNWMSRESLIGGIYSRPLAIGNFLHFFMSSLALMKSSSSTADLSNYIVLLTVLYVLFAISFAYVLFNSPKQLKK